MQHILKCHEIAKTDFVRGQNCHLYDLAGRRYTDFESGTWCTALGHNNPRVNRVMMTQIEKLVHLGSRYPNLLAEEAAAEILRITGIGDGKCVFLSSGSEAVELGVQTAMRVTGKQYLLTFRNSYLAAYGSAGRKTASEWYLYDWSACTSADRCDHLNEIPFEKLGGFVFEPGGSGSGFVKFPPERLVREIAERVREAGGLVIANEVTTGMGRTGKWFGFQHYDVRPDIVSIGKGLGNGYPVSAVAMRSDIAEKMEDSGFHYAQSHQNDPLGCSIAKEVIAILREEHWIEKGDELGAYFLEGLKRLGEKHAVVKEARGRDMPIGLELHRHEKLTAEAVYRMLLERGFLAGYYPAGNMLRFDPALTIDRRDIERLLDCLDQILE
jgi:acetylornithine/N-succinyldiaminopimelate aminotransferase